MQQYDVSIIIPLFKVEKFILECLQSVSAQNADGLKIECLIIDDCSPDKSADITKSFIDSYSGPIDFHLLTHNKNGGLSASRNTGIQSAHGRYLYFLDSDDLITSDCISLLHITAKKHNFPDIVTGDFQTFPTKDVYANISLKNKNFPDFSNDIDWIRSVFLNIFPVIACNKLVSRKFILSNNLYFREGIIHEDNHWQALAYPYVTSVAFLKKVTYLYRMRDESITTSSNSYNKRRFTYLQMIYQEMFAREIKWDFYWCQWVFNNVIDTRFSSHNNSDISNYFHKLISTLLKSKSTPFTFKMLSIYALLPRPIMSWRVIDSIIKKYYSVK